jgi:hypothetical protein
MAARHGRLAEITVATKSLTAYCNSLDLSIDVDTADKSVFGVAYKNSEPGQYGGTLSLKGNYDPTATVGPAVVLSALIGAAAFAVLYYPGGNVAGQRLWTFNALLTSYKESSPVGGLVSFEASLLADGAITPTTI